jgi:hypothetical protein
MSAAPDPEKPPLFAPSSSEDEEKETDNKKRKSKKTSKPAAPVVPKKKVKRGLGFTKEELKNFLDLMEEVVPIGPQQWDTVANRHLQLYPDHGRDITSLRTKFNRLVSATPPTGDPACPEEVRRAKRIFKMIEEKADASQLIDIDELGLDSDKEQSTDGNEKKNEEPSATAVVTLDSSASSINTPTTRFRNPRTPQPAQNTQMEKFMEIMAANMMMDQSRRDEREEERRQRALEQTMAGKRQDMMMMMMMGFVAKMSGTEMPNPNDENDKEKEKHENNEKNDEDKLI